MTCLALCSISTFYIIIILSFHNSSILYSVTLIGLPLQILLGEWKVYLNNKVFYDPARDNQCVALSVDWSVGLSVGRSVSLWVSWSVSVGRSVYQSVCQSVTVCWFINGAFFFKLIFSILRGVGVFLPEMNNSDSKLSRATILQLFEDL